MPKWILTAILCFGISAAASAQEEGNVSLGEALAEANCSQCHNIAPGGAFKLYPPSFTAIAKYMHPEMIPIKIMYPDHSNIMPNFHTFLHPSNLDDIVAYIRSLEE